VRCLVSLGAAVLLLAGSPVFGHPVQPGQRPQVPVNRPQALIGQQPAPGQETELHHIITTNTGWRPVSRRPSRPYRFTQVTSETCRIGRQEVTFEDVYEWPDGHVEYEHVTVVVDEGDPGRLYVVWEVDPATRPATRRENRRWCGPEPPERYRVRAAWLEEWKHVPVPGLGVAPPDRGITGIETFFWATGVPPLVSLQTTLDGHAVESRARPVSYSFETGDGAVYHSSLPGSRHDPAARHVYQRRSDRVTESGFYTVAVGVTWEGEYRVRSPGGQWGPWLPLGSTMTESVHEYGVDEVVARLVGR
jgi:hypothetical protein